jgi:hypothetical protein
MGLVYSTLLNMSIPDSVIDDFVVLASKMLDHWPPDAEELEQIKSTVWEYCATNDIKFIEHQGGT